MNPLAKLKAIFSPRRQRDKLIERRISRKKGNTPRAVASAYAQRQRELMEGK